MDRRNLARLLLAGATGAVLAQGGVPVSTPWDGPTLELDSVQRTLHALAVGYDTFGPRRVGTAVSAAETAMRRVFAEGGMTPRQGRDAAVLYTKLLVMGATAAAATGRYGRAERTAKLAADIAVQAGDGPTAAHAYAVVSASLRNAGSPQKALVAAHRGRSYAGRSPVAAMLLLEEAFAGTRFRRIGADTILDCVHAAEQEQEQLTPDQWGTPSYSLGTYHPGLTKTYTGWSLAQVGMYREAAPRLEEAADLLAGTGGLARAFVTMTQAGVAFGTGDVDAAHDYAAAAVASVEARPEASFDRAVRDLDRRSGGAFADLVEQTSRWGLAAV